MAIVPNYQTGLVIKDLTVEPQPSLTWGMQLDGNRCIGKKDDVDALLQTIFCILSTEQGAYSIYPPTYGLKMRDLYGKPAPYIYAILCDRIRAALTMDDRITAVDNFSYSSTGDAMLISFSVHTNFTDEEIKGAYYVR